MSIKAGAPIIAVIIPTGISVGATIFLAIVSQAVKNAPPASAHAGKTILWSSPEIFLTACGMISPTKPIGPVI